jgi:hypothetical protein
MQIGAQRQPQLPHCLPQLLPACRPQLRAILVRTQNLIHRKPALNE